MDWTSIIITVIINTPAFILIGQQLRKEKASAKKTDAEAADVQVGTSLDLMREMRTDIADLKKRVSSLEVENNWLRHGVWILIQQLRKHGITPEFTLDSAPAVNTEKDK